MKNLFIRLSLVLALLAAGLTAYAQTTVRGTVKDAAGNGVIGASVMVQGTQNGAIVNMDGSFSLSGVKTGDVLEVRRVLHRLCPPDHHVDGLSRQRGPR